QVIADLVKRYKDYQTEQGREINVMMEKAAATAIKDKKSSGNRERSDVMFVTWVPETQRLRVHFRTTISDGLYAYAESNSDFGGRHRTMAVARRGPEPTARHSGSPSTPRYGTQFGVEFGVAYEVSKSGKVERVLTLPMETFQREVKDPGFLQSKNAYGRATMMGLPPADAAVAVPARTAAVR